jgi:glutathione synthase/RimK-type ligase-like ATP-grasp enzyme
VTRVALAGCAGTEDPDAPLLVGALARLGIEAASHAWDDHGVDWASFDTTVVRSTWDYPAALDDFLAWARAVPRLVNPVGVVAWNADKRYLEALATAGVPTIETTYVRSGDTATFPNVPFVVKPSVGGGSRGAARYAPAEVDAAHAHVALLASKGLDAMVQPFVESVDAVGETDVVVIDGEVSHAIIKHAPLRAVATWDPAGPACFERAAPDNEQAAVVAAALAAVPGAAPLCYARVDLVATAAGPSVIEIELIEPFLFLACADAAADRLAAAIARRAAA